MRINNQIKSTVVLLSLVACGQETVDSRSQFEDGPASQSGNTEETIDLGAEGFSFTSYDKAAKNPTCKKAATYSALDIDGDGQINSFSDGPLLALLMSAGAPKSKIDQFSKNGDRTDLRLYFNEVLKPLLDVNGDGKINFFVEGTVIPFYMLAISGMPRAQMLKTLKRFNASEAKLKKLMATRIPCSASNASVFMNQFKLAKGKSFFPNWGGKGNMWFWSKAKAAWFFLDNAQMFRVWTRGTNPAQGQGLGVLHKYYQKNPAHLLEVK